MTAPELIRARIVVREVTRYERVVLMPPALFTSLHDQLASGTAEARADVAAAMFDAPLIDNGACDEEPELLQVALTALPSYVPDSETDVEG
jgi:hypothetical protein